MPDHTWDLFRAWPNQPFQSSGEQGAPKCIFPTSPSPRGAGLRTSRPLPQGLEPPTAPSLSQPGPLGPTGRLSAAFPCRSPHSTDNGKDVASQVDSPHPLILLVSWTRVVPAPWRPSHCHLSPAWTQQGKDRRPCSCPLALPAPPTSPISPPPPSRSSLRRPRAPSGRPGGCPGSLQQAPGPLHRQDHRPGVRVRLPGWGVLPLASRGSG